jgi:hypothetical protein
MNGAWVNVGSGWAKTPEKAWQDAKEYYIDNIKEE